LIKNKLIIHPLLFALFPVLFLYGNNLVQVPFGRTISSLAAVLILAVLLWSVFGLVFRDLGFSAALTSLFLLLFFTYGQFFALIEGVKVSGLELGQHLFLLPLWAGLFGLGFWLCRRARSRPAALTRFFTAMGAALVLVALLPIVSDVFRPAGIKRFGRTAGSPSAELVSLERGGPLPNIYYIILDAYASGKVLEEVYGFDNSEFLDYLSSRGFALARPGRSNYDMSLMSLASSLNYRYLDGDEFRERKMDYLFSLFRENRVVELLRGLGYRLAAFDSGYDNTELRSAEIRLGTGWSPGEFAAELINFTPLPPLLAMIGGGGYEGGLQYRAHRERILYAFENIPETARIEGPLFVFAHILAPHPPFVFDEAGGPVQLSDYYITGDAAGFLERMGISREEYRGYYIAQLKFINRQVMETVDRLLENSETAPIIVIQGDHGPRSAYSFCNLDASNPEEGLSILNAYHLPGGGAEDLYPGITPVNTFRVIFNRYFGAGLELLPDHSYFTDWEDGYFVFRRVF